MVDRFADTREGHPAHLVTCAPEAPHLSGGSVGDGAPLPQLRFPDSGPERSGEKKLQEKAWSN